MHRIDGDAPAIALPTPAAVGATVGYFTEGNPTLGVEATEVTADWLNSVQEELAYVIEQAGGTLDKTSRVQLKTAIDQMIGAKGFDINNLGFTAAVAASALTFSLKTKAGNAPSASDPVRLGFRNATLTTGQYAIRSITSALTLAISSGSTLGNGAAVNEWVYLYALDNAGTVELAASTTLYPDNSIQSTTAEGGAGAADSRTVIYSTTARTSVAIRLIGRIKSSQTVAGTWASAPSELSMAPFDDPVSFSRELSNVGLAASVGSSALTISLKDRLGSDPSSNSPVKVGFRSSTVTLGTFRQQVITGALSVVVSSGSTLGHGSGLDSYIYVYAIDATDLGGGVELAVSTKLFDDNSVQTTTAEGGAGAADAIATLYSTTARAAVPIRLLGRLKSNQVTAGTYAAVPTEISVSGTESGLSWKPPTNQQFTSGSGTYSLPAGVKYIRVRAVGGGAGGAGSALTASGNGGSGTNGGNTTFGPITAGGGAGPAGGLSSGGPGGTASLGSGPVGIAIAGNGGGSNGNVDASRYLGGPAGGPSALGGAGVGGSPGAAGGAATANTGGGGGGSGATNSCISGAAGGSGGFVDAFIYGSNLVATFAYAVGASGAGGTAGTGGFVGGAGGSGYISVDEFYQ